MRSFAFAVAAAGRFSSGVAHARIGVEFAEEPATEIGYTAVMNQLSPPTVEDGRD